MDSGADNDPASKGPLGQMAFLAFPKSQSKMGRPLSIASLRVRMEHIGTVFAFTLTQSAYFSGIIHTLAVLSKMAYMEQFSFGTRFNKSSGFLEYFAKQTNQTKARNPSAIPSHQQ